MYNGGCETHDTFWNRRKFEILMVPTTKKKNQGDANPVWIEGEVFSFYEYNMGPGGELFVILLIIVPIYILYTILITFPQYLI